MKFTKTRSNHSFLETVQFYGMWVIAMVAIVGPLFVFTQEAKANTVDHSVPHAPHSYLDHMVPHAPHSYLDHMVPHAPHAPHSIDDYDEINMGDE